MDYETGSRLERIEAKIDYSIEKLSEAEKKIDYFIEKLSEAEKKAKKEMEPEVPLPPPEYKKK